MPAPALTLPAEFQQRLYAYLNGLGREAAQSARDVMDLSDFYLKNSGGRTPWDKSFCKNAYLNYFLPLNTARLVSVMRDLQRFLPAQSVSEVWDFGAGLGATQWAMETLTDWEPRKIHALEADKSATSLYRELQAVLGARWPVEFNSRSQPASRALAVFSYSFLEMQNVLPDLRLFDHLLIVEPSTQERGRELMQWRARLMRDGFNPLAPCTHAADCPLLVNSARDWCHMRMHFAAPEEFRRLEEHLPMKNRTLTYSYLLMSRSVTDGEWRGSARVIGDTLVENGKTKQMICRGSRREFLSWLHRHGVAPAIPHGALVRGVDAAEVKGSELRAAPGSLEWVI